MVEEDISQFFKFEFYSKKLSDIYGIFRDGSVCFYKKQYFDTFIRLFGLSFG